MLNLNDVTIYYYWKHVKWEDALSGYRKIHVVKTQILTNRCKHFEIIMFLHFCFYSQVTFYLHFVILYRFPILKAALNDPRKDAPLVFCKSASPVIAGRYDLLPDASSQYRYSFLLRHPLQVFNSFKKAIFNVASQLPSSTVAEEHPKSWEEFHLFRDVPDRYRFKGRLFKELYDVWKYVKENLDPNPVIIDSDDVLADPARMLSKYCAALGIPYSDGMIAWDDDPGQADNWWLPFKPCFDFQFFRIVHQGAFYWLVSNGGVAGAGWGRDGDGDGHTLSRQAPPVVSKGWVESGEFNKRATSRQPGGGACLERVCWVDSCSSCFFNAILCSFCVKRRKQS